MMYSVILILFTAMDSRSRDTKRRRMDTSLDKRPRDRTTYRSPENNRHTNNYNEFESAYKQDSLSYFYPDKPEEPIEKWLRKVEDARKVNNWSESSTIYYALNKLKGSAESWYKSLPDMKLSWEEWKEKLIQAFPSTKDYYELLEDMVKRKKVSDETYSKYFFDKLALINLCKISGRDAVACVIGGLSEDLKPSARMGNFKEPEEIYEYLQTLNRESATKGRNYTSDNAHVSGYKDTSSRGSYQKPKDNYRAKNLDTYVDTSYRPKDKDTKSYREREPRMSYNDKSTASTYREKDSRDYYKEPRVEYRGKDGRDPYLEKDSRASYHLKETDLRLTLGEKCYSCGETGHFAKFCPRFKEIRYCKVCYRTDHTEDQCYDRKLLL